jgi:hypothetical protein
MGRLSFRYRLMLVLGAMAAAAAVYAGPAGAWSSPPPSYGYGFVAYDGCTSTYFAYQDFSSSQQVTESAYLNGSSTALATATVTVPAIGSPEVYTSLLTYSVPAGSQSLTFNAVIASGPDAGYEVGGFPTTPNTYSCQTIAGNIYLCSNGSPTTTLANGGTLTVSSAGISSGNPLSPTNVAAGTYTMSATAPSGYEFVGCGQTGVTTSGSPPTSASQSVNVPAGGSGVGNFYVASTAPPCTSGTNVNVRWHYSYNGSSGSWSGTYGVRCPGTVTSHQQAMEGNLQVPPGATVLLGYDLTAPGQNNVDVTVTDPTVTFEQVACVNGSIPTATSFSETLPSATYTGVNGGAWSPTDQQSSSAAYEGSVTVPNLCNGGLVSLQQGGIFTASIS